MPHFNNLEDYKNYYSKLINYEHFISNGGDVTTANRIDFPLEFNFLTRNYKYEQLMFYKHNLQLDIHINRSDFTVYKDVYEFLEENVSELNVEFYRHLDKIDFIKKFLKKYRLSFKYSTYTDDFSKNVTPLTLQYFSKKYEITEFLMLWKWILDFINNKPLEEDFKEFRYRKKSENNIMKGRLIDYIEEGLNDYPVIKMLFSKIYNKDIRNYIDHNDLEIVDGKLISIEDNKIIMNDREFLEIVKYQEAFFNCTLGYFTIKHYHVYQSLIYNITNEGFIHANSIGEHFGKNILCLYQLYPFYSYDVGKNAQIIVDNIVSNGDFYYLFSKKKVLMKLYKNDILKNHFKNQQELKIIVFPIKPKLLESNINVRTALGEFIKLNEYYIANNNFTIFNTIHV